MDGIVRRARRPPGWVAPGPPPGHGDAAEPAPGEDLCYLAGDWRILQRIDDHRWSLDDLVTAWFAAETVRDHPPDAALDLGCGIGAVLLLVAWRFPAARCIGIEAEDASVGLARRSIARNGVTERCRVVHGDLRDPDVLPSAARFDLVTGTPPYLAPRAATPSRRIQRRACHFEYRGGLEAYCLAAARHLTRDGRFVVCAAAAQDGRMMSAAHDAGLAVERRRDVIPREGKRALFSVYAMRPNATADAAAVEPPLVVRDRAGHRTAAFRAVRETMGMPP